MKSSRIFRPYRFMSRNSVKDIAMCVCLCTLVTIGEHLAYRELFINITSTEKYLGTSWTPKHFGHFLLALGFGLDRI